MENPAQPKLFIVEEDTSSGTLELFPTVWQAAEKVASKHEDIRHTGLDELLTLNALRFSPLIIYITATRLRDPSLTLRARVIEALANVLRADADGKLAPDQVREYLISHIAQFDQIDIFAILEAVVHEEEIHPHIVKLLNYCSRAGRFLAQIVADRRNLIRIRRYSANFIGQIGFIEALSTLERVRNRLESQQGNQKSMPFGPSTNPDESILLLDINRAISLLQTPES